MDTMELLIDMHTIYTELKGKRPEYLVIPPKKVGEVKKEMFTTLVTLLIPKQESILGSILVKNYYDNEFFFACYDEIEVKHMIMNPGVFGLQTHVEPCSTTVKGSWRKDGEFGEWCFVPDGRDHENYYGFENGTELMDFVNRHGEILYEYLKAHLRRE